MSYAFTRPFLSLDFIPVSAYFVGGQRICDEDVRILGPPMLSLQYQRGHFFPLLYCANRVKGKINQNMVNLLLIVLPCDDKFGLLGIHNLLKISIFHYINILHFREKKKAWLCGSLQLQYFYFYICDTTIFRFTLLHWQECVWHLRVAYRYR